MKAIGKNLMFAAVLMSAPLAWADAGALTANAWCSAQADLGGGSQIAQRYEFKADGTMVMEGLVTSPQGKVLKVFAEPASWTVEGSQLTIVLGTATTVNYAIEPAQDEPGKSLLTLSAPEAPTMRFTSCK